MRIRALAALAAAVVLSFTVIAQEKPDAAKAAADEKAMMDAWMKVATPNENHKALAPFVGTFDVKVRSWMAPGAPVVESTGVAESNWALGGRYVQMNFKSSFMGMPFEGIGYTGYDNTKQQYASYWMDNMGTWGMASTGRMDSPGKMTFTGTSPDPMTGKDTTVTEKIHVVSADKHTMEMWCDGPDGKPYKMMEMEYTRRK
jgi:hypothetical protein